MCPAAPLSRVLLPRVALVKSQAAAVLGPGTRGGAADGLGGEGLPPIC